MGLEQNPPGRLAKLYYHPTTLITDNSQSGIETWLNLAGTVIAGDVFDLSEAVESEYVDITTRSRASGGFGHRKPILRNGELTFDFAWETQAISDAFVQLLIDSARDFTMVPMVALDYAFDDANLTTGEFAQGPAGNWYIGFSKGEAIRDIQRGSCTAVAGDLCTWFEHSAA